MKIAICSSGYQLCGEMEKIVSEYARQIKIQLEAEVFFSSNDFIRFIQNCNTFDLIFLDLDLKGIPGMKIGKMIRNEMDDYQCKLIFLGSELEFGEKILEVQPFYCLRKPIDRNKVIKCVEIAEKMLKREKSFFEYHVRREVRRVKTEHIIYFENNLKKIKIVMLSGEDYFYSNFEHIIEKLPDIFIRPHGSFLINLEHVERITKQSIHMFGGAAIPVSRRKLSNILGLNNIPFIPKI